MEWKIWKKKINILEWTENFDGYQFDGQTRALREVYHFISAQQRHLNQELSSKIIFVNILDGDECNRKINLLPELEHDQIFIGSLFEWSK